MPTPLAEIDHQALREAYLRTGSQKRAAAAVGISERTLNRHRSLDPDLAALIEEAREELRRLRRENRKHGRTRYNEGCRCDVCREANRVAHRKGAKTRRNRPFNEIPHGVNGYRNYGCRCETCTDAGRAAMRAYRQGLKGVA